ncbi:NADH-ubiquinone oxidoreductase 39-40 kDa subunit -like protein [Granulibacter bethesdensis]|nr:NADH-ubiquinone oxidoreductase 39-40 kDa subunit -like protein [Granulibacter bethesdensis]
MLRDGRRTLIRENSVMTTTESVPVTQSTMAGRIATVFGGSGFLGQSLIRLLAREGYQVRVPVRDPEQVLKLKSAGSVGQIVPLGVSLGSRDAEAGIARAVQGASLVVNLVGLLAEARKGDFQRVHVQAAGLIASLSAQAGVLSFVHISALGADPASRSAYGRSKAEGEEAVRSALPQAAILRPSVVFGAEDHFFNRFAAMAVSLPVVPVIYGNSRMQPVYVEDVARAILAASTQAAGNVIELGGPEVVTMRDIQHRILTMIGRKKPLIDIPDKVAMALAMIAEKMPGRPLTTDQLAMLGSGSVVSPQALTLETLGIVPTPIDLVVPHYLSRFRAGGLVAPRVRKTTTP